MLRVPIAALAVHAAVVFQPLRVEVFVDSCSQGPIDLGGHLAVCGSLGCLMIICGRDSGSDNSHPPCCNHHNGGNCHFGGSYRSDSHPLGGNRRRVGRLSPSLVLIATVGIIAPVVVAAVIVLLPIPVVVFVSVAGKGSLRLVIAEKTGTGLPKDTWSFHLRHYRLWISSLN